MIYEYALEPELVATWSDRKQARYFKGKFGLGTTRIVSRYPKTWTKLVWESFKSENDIERKRLAEVLVALTECTVKRPGGVRDASAAWLENAQQEHGRLPFRAIVARNNPKGHSQVLGADEIDDTTPLWEMEHGVATARRAADMTAAVSPMLQLAEAVVFVDQHFDPSEPRWREPLELFLGTIGSRPDKVLGRLELQYALERKNSPSPAFFQSRCEKHLPGCVPKGMRLDMTRLRPREGHEQLHNRYILTDIGGVDFGVGIDQGPVGANDDIHLLPRGQYELRWRQYASTTPDFDRPEGTFTIKGIA